MEFINTEKKIDTKEISYVLEGFKNGTIKDGDKVTVKGTLHRIKEMSGFAFVILRSARMCFQCIWEEDKSDCDIKDFSVEECVVVDGTLIVEERSRIGFDIRIDKMTRISGRAEVPPVEIGNDRKMEKLNLNTLLDNRIISLRNPKIRAILKIADGVQYAFRSFLREEGFTEFVPPKMVTA
ncbi:MAG: hypothetical protein J6Q67_04110, partial [Clostridia bacterium]|nr:hypothetical protein [Clostridia bacterium]